MPKTEEIVAKEEPAVAAEGKTEEAAPELEVKTEQDEQDEQTYEGDQDMDDDIDFNLGNGISYDSPANHETHGPGIKEDG